MVWMLPVGQLLDRIWLVAGEAIVDPKQDYRSTGPPAFFQAEKPPSI